MRKSNATNGDNLGTIGSRIRNLRKEKHITQETLEKICAVLGCTLDDIVEIKPDNSNI